MDRQMGSRQPALREDMRNGDARMNDNGQPLSKKRVLIVGGGGAGIGRAITAAAGAAGGELAIVDIDADRAKEAAESVVTAGGTATPIQADVLSLPDIERAVST